MAVDDDVRLERAEALRALARLHTLEEGLRAVSQAEGWNQDIVSRLLASVSLPAVVDEYACYINAKVVVEAQDETTARDTVISQMRSVFPDMKNLSVQTWYVDKDTSG